MSRAAAIGKLHDELVAFANQPEQRLLVIETEDALRVPVLEQIETLDLLTKDQAVVSMFESPWMAGDACWDARHEEFDDEWESLSKAFVREKLPALAPLPDAGAGDIGSFAKRIEFAAAKLSAHFPALFIVFAPIAIEDAPRLAQEVAAMVAHKSLASCRWVVATVGPSGLEPVVVAAGKAAALVRVLNDDQADAAGMKAAVAAMATAPIGAPSIQFAGGVGPRVAPPPRPNAAAKPAEGSAAAATLAPADVSPAMADAVAMQDVRIAVMEAALAAGDKNFAKAIESQRRARTTTLRLGMVSETATLDLMLGSYALMAGQPKMGLEVFVDVEQRAQAAGLGPLAVQAAMARGGALSLLDRRLDAAAAYTEGGRAGVKFGAMALALESFGMGGQILADLNDVRRALAVWNEGLATAEQAKPEDVAGSSILETAGKAIELLRKHGATAEATHWIQRRSALSAAIEAASAKETA
ncbi:MAG: hypothetical protein SF187_17495 [Deltaproteobacteria bacterium]|nr:hypothetical protein [Deltaproteobacteria bacterium]